MRVATDHPALPGHFPGHAIVPGVVILDCVIHEWRRVSASLARITGVSSVKFTAPLLPAQEFRVVIRDRPPGRFTFEVISPDATIASGTITFETD